MKNLRRKFAAFCQRNRNKGIPHLMLWIGAGNLLVFLLASMDPSGLVVQALSFSPSKILQGQVWRLVSYVFLYLVSSDAYQLLVGVVMLLVYYSIGNSLESIWGRLRFNFYYISGVVLSDLLGLIFRIPMGISYVNLSLFLAYATLFPDERFLILWVIPIRARWLGLISLGVTLWTTFSGLLMAPASFTYLIPVVSLLNYFLYFGKDICNLLPMSWRVKMTRRRTPGAKTIPFPSSASSSARPAEKPYTHKCPVCGRTDVSNPELEFRYCSKCKGYYCYCSDHINNHVHIQ